jgi:hypothetical protein
MKSINASAGLFLCLAAFACARESNDGPLRAQVADQSRKLEQQRREIADLKESATKANGHAAQIASRARDCSNELLILKASRAAPVKRVTAAVVPPKPTRESSFVAPKAAAEFANRPAPATTGATWNDVMAASNYQLADDVIKQHCQTEWPSDPRMLDYCSQSQKEAVRILDKGRPFGTDQNKWNAARVSCAAQWPTDYAMRLFCEDKGAR